jgi:excisionase family DNA binding protein
VGDLAPSSLSLTPKNLQVPNIIKEFLRFFFTFGFFHSRIKVYLKYYKEGRGNMKSESKSTLEKGKGSRMDHPNLDGEEVLTFNEVSAFLRMGEKAIYNGIKNGVIPAVKIGNAFRFSKQAVLETLDSKRAAKNRMK